MRQSEGRFAAPHPRRPNRQSVSAHLAHGCGRGTPSKAASSCAVQVGFVEVFARNLLQIADRLARWIELAAGIIQEVEQKRVPHGQAIAADCAVLRARLAGLALEGAGADISR